MQGVTNDMRKAAYAAVKQVIEQKEDEAEQERLFLLARELADAALDAAGQVVLDAAKRAAEEARMRAEAAARAAALGQR